MFDPTTNETPYLPLDENDDGLLHEQRLLHLLLPVRQHEQTQSRVHPQNSRARGGGLFQESLKEVLEYSPTVDTSNWIHATEVNFSITNRSRLQIVLAVKKTPGYYTVFRNYNSLLQIYICKELATTLHMANSSVWIYFPQWYDVRQKLTVDIRGMLEDEHQFDGMACVPKKDLFSTVEGKVEGTFPITHTTSNPDYTRVLYKANFKLRRMSSSEKLYDKENYKIHVEVPLILEYDEQNLVQYLHIHCNELLYDPVFRSVNRPNGGSGAKIANADMRQLHYKRMISGLRRLQEFQIEIKDK